MTKVLTQFKEPGVKGLNILTLTSGEPTASEINKAKDTKKQGQQDTIGFRQQ